MSVRINFLPATYQPPRKLGVKDYGAIGAATAVLALGTLYYANAYADLANTEARVENTRQQIAVAKAKVAELDNVRAREQRVAQAEMEIKALKGRHWSPVLLAFRDLTPQRMYWTDFKVEKGVVTISGNTEGLMDLAQFVVGLMTSPAVGQVDLQIANAAGTVVDVSMKQGENVPDALTAYGNENGRLAFTMTIKLVPVSEGGQA